MGLEELLSAIGSVGFPVACCIYMMVSNNKTLQNLTNAVHAMTAAINTLIRTKDPNAEEIPMVTGDPK